MKLSVTLPEKNSGRTWSVFTNHSLEYSPSYCKFKSNSASDWLNRLLSQSKVVSLSRASKNKIKKKKNWKTRPRTLSMMFGIEVLLWYWFRETTRISLWLMCPRVCIYILSDVMAFISYYLLRLQILIVALARLWLSNNYKPVHRRIGRIIALLRHVFLCEVFSPCLLVTLSFYRRKKKVVPNWELNRPSSYVLVLLKFKNLSLSRIKKVEWKGRKCLLQAFSPFLHIVFQCNLLYRS